HHGQLARTARGGDRHLAARRRAAHRSDLPRGLELDRPRFFRAGYAGRARRLKRRMPFTLAPPAAILPLRGLRSLRTAPLVIGAMIPDLPSYLPGRFSHLRPETHSVAGSFTTCLVLGYAALGAVYLLRRPLTALLTPRARWVCLGALAPFRRRPLEWALASVSIELGVWTHLLWDSFTHENGWMVRRV